MTFKELEHKIKQYQSEGKKYFTTSSFQSHSLVLLHMLSKIDSDIPVYFINTGYHFPDTVAFRDKIMADFGLNNLVDLKPLTPKNMQRDANGKMFFTSDPDYCCYLNKTQPMDAVLMQHDIWINGVRADQSKTRSAMKEEQAAPHGSIRLHPMLDWNSKMIHDYRKEHQLPDHPLEAKGYFSIGCEPCTRKFDLDMQERESRWYGMNKTECGLHTDLVK
ncbi:phosphoadenylyl-sulfate reductase [Marivirga tractuosa]|uniref:phosphoadenylyl-sulfate reductase n=1 Tax=Marivirga tractuosa TaxID=1006 RepID=UPI0035D02806